MTTSSTTLLRSERDLLETLDEGTYTLSELYEAAEKAGLADRVVIDAAGTARSGREKIQDGQPAYRRRVRSALLRMETKERVRRVGDGTWVITKGTKDNPQRAMLVLLSGYDGDDVELALGSAAQVLANIDEPIDIVLADPPWALERSGKGSSSYNRDGSKVLSGYAEVRAGSAYTEFLTEWMGVAMDVLRPGAYLAVVTGAQQSARVQVVAEDLGLTYVNSIVSRRAFGVFSTRRAVHSHNRVTLLTKGPLNSPKRFFAIPSDAVRRGPSGGEWMSDFWDSPETTEISARRPGLLRYDNALPPRLVGRIIESCTRTGDLVVDPFLGSGTTALEALRAGRRFRGGDINPESLRFTMARLLAEHRWPDPTEK
jgi:DNA modification methylase